MNSGKGEVGIPVNVGSPSNVVSTIHGGAVNLSQRVNNSVNTNISSKPAMSSPMINNLHIPSNSPRTTTATTNLPNGSSSNTFNTINNNNINININRNNMNVSMNKNLSPAELQQRQRLLMQQRLLQQQKAMKVFENQFFQLLMTLNKKPKRIYNFVEETDLILQKYEQYRPSFEFHIYEDKFRICAPSNSRFQQQQQQQQQQQVENSRNNKPNITSKDHPTQNTNISQNNGLILEKNDETLKEFLEYVARGRIPEAIMEVLRDCNIQFYEGNLILQVYDHTNTVEVTINRPIEGNSMNSTLATKVQANNTINSNNNSVQGQHQHTLGEQIRKFRRPRVYRTLLRPNDLTNYYDMMTYADQARFSDSIYQQFESEILTLTKRNIKLDVDLNPFEHREKIDEDEFCEPKFNKDTQTMEFVHREECTNDGTKGKVGHIPEHEEVSQNISDYEQLMLIMSERTSTITESTLAASLSDVSNKLNGDFTNNNVLETSRHSSVSLNSIPGSLTEGFKSPELKVSASGSNEKRLTSTINGKKTNHENVRFGRIKFIEQWKINVEKRKQQMALNGNNSVNGLLGTSVPGTPFMTKISMTIPMTPQSQLLQQQQQFQQFQQQQQLQHSAQVNERKSTGRGTKRGTTNTSEKPKAKRTKKTKKDSDGPQQTPKRKRVSKKKQAAADSNNNSTVVSPTSQSTSNIGTPI